MESPILPRKYLIKEIKGEPEEETKLRWDHTVNSFQTDIAIISNKYSRFRSKYENIDAQISEEISKLAKGNTADKIRELWITDISKEEEKSHKLWKPKAVFLDKYAQNYGKEPVEMKHKRKKQNQQTQRKVSARPRSKPRQQNTFKGSNKTIMKGNQNSDKNKKSNPRVQSRSHSKSQKRSYSDAVKNGTRRQTSQSAQSKHPNNGPNQRRRPLWNNQKKTKPGDKFQPKKKVGNRFQGAVYGNRNNYRENGGQNTNEKFIHFLEVGPQNPERDKETEQTLPKEIDM